jgi:hypothetical protein
VAAAWCQIPLKEECQLSLKVTVYKQNSARLAPITPRHYRNRALTDLSPALEENSSVNQICDSRSCGDIEHGGFRAS